MASQSWNVFTGNTRSASNPDSLPTAYDNSGPCPWCGRVSNFKVEDSEKWLHSAPTGYNGGYEATHLYAILRCDGCGNAVLSVTDRAGQGVHWYPPPGAGTLDRQVNVGVASAYDEGMKCQHRREPRRCRDVPVVAEPVREGQGQREGAGGASP